MIPHLRRTGLAFLSDLPWGTHVCFFAGDQSTLVSTSSAWKRPPYGYGDGCSLLHVDKRLLFKDSAPLRIRTNSACT